MFTYAQTNNQLYSQMHELGYTSADIQSVDNAYYFALPFFSCRYRNTGKPFLSHLIGAASILVVNHSSIPVIIAGMLHAIYQQGEFGKTLKLSAKRAIVRQAVDPDIEELIYLYDQINNNVWPCKSDTPFKGISQGNDLLILFLANDLEECLDNALYLASPQKRDSMKKSIACSIFHARARHLDDIANELEKQLEQYESTNLTFKPHNPGIDRSYNIYSISPEKQLIRGFKRRIRGLLGKKN